MASRNISDNTERIDPAIVFFLLQSTNQETRQYGEWLFLSENPSQFFFYCLQLICPNFISFLDTFLLIRIVL